MAPGHISPFSSLRITYLISATQYFALIRGGKVIGLLTLVKKMVTLRFGVITWGAGVIHPARCCDVYSWANSGAVIHRHDGVVLRGPYLGDLGNEYET